MDDGSWTWKSIELAFEGSTSSGTLKEKQEAYFACDRTQERASEGGEPVGEVVSRSADGRCFLEPGASGKSG